MNFSGNEESHQEPVYLQPFWGLSDAKNKLHMKCQYQPGKKISQTATTKDKSWVKPGGGRREMHSSMSFDQLVLP